MVVLAIEWQISQHLKQPDTTWDQVMDHFLKVCKRVCVMFVLIFVKFIFTACFGSDTFVVG